MALLGFANNPGDLMPIDDNAVLPSQCLPKENPQYQERKRQVAARHCL